MLNKLMVWWLRLEYRYHQKKMGDCCELCVHALLTSRNEDEDLWFKEYQYHNKRCKHIETMIHTLKGV